MDRLRSPFAEHSLPSRQPIYPFRGVHEPARQQGAGFVSVSRARLRIHAQLDFIPVHGHDLQAVRRQGSDENFPACAVR